MTTKWKQDGNKIRTRENKIERNYMNVRTRRGWDKKNMSF